MMNTVLSLASAGLAQLGKLLARQLDSQEAQASFRGDMARDEFFLPQLMGARERALFLSSRTQKDDADVRHD